MKYIVTLNGKNYEIEVEKELFPVCPNCHAMLHRRKDSTLSIEELKLIIQQNND